MKVSEKIGERGEGKKSSSLVLRREYRPSPTPKDSVERVYRIKRERRGDVSIKRPTHSPVQPEVRLSPIMD